MRYALRVMLFLFFTIVSTDAVGSEDCFSWRGPLCLFDANKQQLEQDKRFQAECVDQIEAAIRVLHKKNESCLDGIAPDYDMLHFAFFGALPSHMYDDYCEAIDNVEVCEKVSKRLAADYRRVFMSKLLGGKVKAKPQ